MDEFVSFNFVLLDASGGSPEKVKIVERGTKRERIDVIARQFHDFLSEGDQSDTTPHGMLLSPDFKLRRQVSQKAGWLTFLTDPGAGQDEALEEVALVVFAAADDEEGRKALERLTPYVNLAALPTPPLVVAVNLSEKVPAVIGEWYGKTAAGFFSQRP